MVQSAIFRTSAAIRVLRQLSDELCRHRRHIHSVVSVAVPQHRQETFLRRWISRTSCAIALAEQRQWANVGKIVFSLQLREEWIIKIRDGALNCFDLLTSRGRRWREICIREGEARSLRARNALVQGSLRLVFPFVRTYLAFPSIDCMDLVQEGNRGLLRAAEKWDWRRQIRFGIYAAWWIRMSIGQAVDRQLHIVHLPAPVLMALRRARVEMDASADLSLSCAIAEDGESWGDLLPAPNHSPEESANQESIRRLIASVLRHLPAREAQVLRLRYGLDGKGERTLGQIGAIYRISEERVRQICEGALERIREIRAGGKLREIK